jgi:hypothetical protein
MDDFDKYRPMVAAATFATLAVVGLVGIVIPFIRGLFWRR